MFVLCTKPSVEKPVFKQRLSQWIVEAISLFLQILVGDSSPHIVFMNIPCGLASSWALFKEVSIKEVCAATFSVFSDTFARFYKLDMKSPAMAHSTLSASSYGFTPY